MTFATPSPSTGSTSGIRKATTSSTSSRFCRPTWAMSTSKIPRSTSPSPRPCSGKATGASRPASRASRTRRFGAPSANHERTPRPSAARLLPGLSSRPAVAQPEYDQELPRHLQAPARLSRLPKTRLEALGRSQDLDAKTVLAFLRHLEDPVGGRGNCAQSRNLRLAAIQCFFKYISLHAPASERQAKRIFAIPDQTCPSQGGGSLDRKELEALARTAADIQRGRHPGPGYPDFPLQHRRARPGGRRRARRLVRFPNRTVSIIGKGQRQRITPLWPSTVRLLKLYRDEPPPQA